MQNKKNVQPNSNFQYNISKEQTRLNRSRVSLLRKWLERDDYCFRPFCLSVLHLVVFKKLRQEILSFISDIIML